jgi:hypothetical protein
MTWRRLLRMKRTAELRLLYLDELPGSATSGCRPVNMLQNFRLGRDTTLVENRGSTVAQSPSSRQEMVSLRGRRDRATVEKMRQEQRVFNYCPCGSQEPVERGKQIHRDPES